MIDKIESLQDPALLQLCEAGSFAFIIDNDGREFEIDKTQIAFYLAENKKTVKVEGLESVFIQYKPQTVHLYIAPQNAASFGLHCDPYNVIIHVMFGKKTFIIDGKDIVVNANETITIPANVEHAATNNYDSVMLSIGD